MNKTNMNRRLFLQSALYSGLLYGTGSLPGILRSATAAPAPVGNRTLINLNLSGGPDMRHLVVPAYDANPKEKEALSPIDSCGQTPRSRANPVRITADRTNFPSP